MSIRRIVPIEQAEWRIAPAPAWVERREPDWELPPSEGCAVDFLLLDEQHDVATDAGSYRNVRRLLTHAAVQSLGQVELEFDPAAHRLAIHELAVWRAGPEGRWEKTSSLTRRESFLLRQREQQLEQQILNGRVSLVALLEDVRVGDAIDLAWTLEPLESLPGMRFAAFFAFVWTVPVARAYFSLRLDPARPVTWRLHAPEGVAKPIEEIGVERATWRMERPPNFVPEPNVPGGYWAFPVVDVSGWTAWSQVADYFRELWGDALADGGELLTTEATRLRSGSDGLRAARAAIRFVQDEVRYLAVDFGHGAGMLPNGAGTVLRRRFGDCKDKAVLLTALLRALGLEAWPMLVAPGWRRAVARVQPSTAAFSHAIVAFVASGTTYFVDATTVGQGGDFPDLVQPPYGVGLEVRSGAADLTELPELAAAELTVTETFQLDGKHRTGWVEQVIHATAWLADDMRGALTRQGHGAFFKSLADGLQNHFPALVPGEPGTVTDRFDANAIEVRSTHALPTWGPPNGKLPQAFAYGAHGLFLAVESTEGPETRRQPWALRHPMRVHHRVVVRGSCVGKGGAPTEHRFSGPGFRYSCDVVAKNHEVSFDYRWETTASEVAPDQWQEYCRARVRALETAGGAIVPTSTSRSVKGPSAFRIFAGVVATMAVLNAARSCTTARTDAPGGERRAQVHVGRQHVDREMREASEAMRRGDFARAEPVVERLLPRFDSSFDFQVMRAELALRMGYFDRGREAIAAARGIDPSHVVLDELQAFLHEQQGELRLARGILEQVVARAPEDARAFASLARVAEQMGDSAAARGAWESVLALQPGHPEPVLRYALLLWRAGERDRGDAVIADVVRAQPAPSAPFEAALSDYYSATGRPAEALAAAQRASELAPSDPGYAHRRVIAQLRSGQTVTALAAAREMTVRFPADPAALTALATVAAAAGDVDTASLAFERLRKAAPRDPNVAANYGFFLHESGRSEEARSVLESAARDFPGAGAVWLNYAVVLEALGEHDFAAVAREKAESLMPASQRATLLR